jgi:hypothetical protein
VDTVTVVRPGEQLRIAGARGVVAIDGEREIEFCDAGPTVSLSLAGPWSLDLGRAMATAAARGLLSRGI